MRYPYSVDGQLLSKISSNDWSVFSIDLDGNLSFCNDVFQRVYQIVGESVIGVNIDALMNSSDVGLIKSAVHQLLMQKMNTPLTVTLKQPGILLGDDYITYTISPVSDRRDHPIAFVLIGTLNQESDKQSIYKDHVDATILNGQNREWFREVANYMNAMIWMSNHLHQMIYVNQAWLKFRGMSIDVELDKGWIDGVYSDDQYVVNQALQEAYHSKKSFDIQFRFRKYDASYRWVQMEGAPMYSSLDDFIGYTGTLTDITSIKEVQLQLNRQKEQMELSKAEFAKFTKIAQRINVVIVLCNTSYHITWVNDSFVKLTGFTLREVNGKNPIDILSGADTDPVIISKLRKAIEQGKSLRTELVFYAKNGNKIWLDLKFETLFDKVGNIIGFLTLQNDITKKKMTEKDVEAQMQHLKEIANIASFELRHEFSKILQILQTAKFQQHSLEGYQQILSDIETSANTMNQAISKISDEVGIASNTNLSLNKFLLNQTIEEIILVDDDHMINKLNSVIIRNVIPNMPVTIFDNIDEALDYLTNNPTMKRKIFLDLNFMGRNGWDFLDAFEKMNQPWPVIILTSSIDHNDYEKSKKYANVTHFITKPLTVPQFEALSELDETAPFGQ
jgi:PAS domain S-box-containing protein